MAVLGVLSVGLLVAVLAGFAEPWLVWLDLLASLRLHLGVLAAAVALAAVLVGAVWAALPAGVAAALAFATLGPLWSPAERMGPPDGHPIRVLFANVRIDNPNVVALERTLVAAGADIVIVAEGPETIGHADSPLDRAYPHRAAARRGPLRTALFSRLPLERERINLNINLGPLAAGAVVRIDDRTALGVLGVHFFKWRNRVGKEAQLRGLRWLSDRLGPPLVVIGDFNTSVWSNRVARTAETTGTSPLGGWRVTWRGRYPFGIPALVGQQIDHLLTSPGIGVRGLRTVPLPGSDHFGLIAELVVPPGGTGDLALSEQPLGY